MLLSKTAPDREEFQKCGLIYRQSQFRLLLTTHVTGQLRSTEIPLMLPIL